MLDNCNGNENVGLVRCIKFIAHIFLMSSFMDGMHRYAVCGCVKMVII